MTLTWKSFHINCIKWWFHLCIFPEYMFFDISPKTFLSINFAEKGFNRVYRLNCWMCLLIYLLHPWHNWQSVAHCKQVHIVDMDYLTVSNSFFFFRFAIMTFAMKHCSLGYYHQTYLHNLEYKLWSDCFLWVCVPSPV